MSLSRDHSLGNPSSEESSRRSGPGASPSQRAPRSSEGRICSCELLQVISHGVLQDRSSLKHRPGSAPGCPCDLSSEGERWFT
jgi:hypothetical protein